MTPKPQKRLRLVGVDLQARFVIDDGDTLEEMTANPVHVLAKDWPTYAARFEADRLTQEKLLNETD